MSRYITVVRPSLRKDPNKLWYIKKPIVSAESSAEDSTEELVMKHMQLCVASLHKDLESGDLTDEVRAHVQFVLEEYELFKQQIKEITGISVENEKRRKEITLLMHRHLQQLLY